MTEKVIEEEDYHRGEARYGSNEKKLEGQLKFGKAQLVGREKELAVLNSIWKQNCNGVEKSVVVPFTLLSGYSGCGKSKLVEYFVESLKNVVSSSDKKSIELELEPEQVQQTFFFLQGKYDHSNKSTPFSAIIAACCDFASQLLQRGEEEFELITGEINQALGEEAIATLISVVPAFKKILEKGIKAQRTSSSQPITSCGSYRVDQLKYIFQTFFDVISSKSHPVMLFLDDMQYIDTGSLSLLTSLLTNTSINHFLVVGAIRSNEIDEDHPLFNELKKIEKVRPVEKIEVHNLSLEVLAIYLTELLDVEQSVKCNSLAEFIYEKTRGNPFYTKALLEELYRKGILYFDVTSFEWEWDLINKSLQDGLLDNIFDIVAEKIKSIPEKLQEVLIVAAHTHFTFDVEILEIMIRVTGFTKIKDTAELEQLLETLVLEGILSNSVGSAKYNFAHDGFRQAVYSLVKDGKDRKKLKNKIGRKLYELGTNVEGEDWMLFVAADHLNSTVLRHQEIMFMARLNFDVGERASLVAAYSSALLYLNKSLKLLKRLPNYWKDYYNMTFRLHELLASVELASGNFETGVRLSQKLFDQSKTDFEKLPTYISLAKGMTTQERHFEAKKLNWIVLEILEEHRPSMLPIKIITTLFKVKSIMKKHSNESILNFPVLEGENERMKILLYHEIVSSAYYCNDFPEMVYAILRQMQLSFQHGLCGTTAASIANYGMLLQAFGDEKGSLRAAQLARQILEKTQEKRVEAKVMLIIANTIEAWSVPHSKTVETFQVGHKSGMEHGDFHFGLLCLFLMIQHSHMVGYNLNEIDAALADAEIQLLQYNVKETLLNLKETQLAVHYLTGQGVPEINWDKLNDFSNVDSSPLREAFGCIARLHLAVIFREFSFAIKMAEKASNFVKQDIAHTNIIMHKYLWCLAATGLARQKKEKKYIRLAKKISKEINKLSIDKGGSLTHHKYLLVEAEILSLGSATKNVVHLSYVTAINAAISTGHVNDAALGNELAGEYLISIGENELAKKHLSESRNFYIKWGALAKVNELEETRNDFICNGKLKKVPPIKGGDHSDSSTISTKPISLHGAYSVESTSISKAA